VVLERGKAKIGRRLVFEITQRGSPPALPLHANSRFLHFAVAVAPTPVGMTWSWSARGSEPVFERMSEDEFQCGPGGVSVLTFLSLLRSLLVSDFPSHGWRRGLCSVAASRLVAELAIAFFLTPHFSQRTREMGQPAAECKQQVAPTPVGMTEANKVSSLQK
jgi:hypothetical protein